MPVMPAIERVRRPCRGMPYPLSVRPGRALLAAVGADSDRVAVERVVEVGVAWVTSVVQVAGGGLLQNQTGRSANVIGHEVEGEVTGIVDFGVFVKLEENLEGLVHISEIDWGLVEDPRDFFAVEDKVRVKIIEIKDGKISLSIKALKENPWSGASDKYKKGDEVTGVVIKYNKHGALASIEEGVAGLVHISEFESTETLQETLELGKTYPFTITLFEPKEQRMTLSYKKEDKSE